ncbi:MAG: hypothetical protein IIA87_05570 [Nanoarchaeota archaeon]|nr:hypothetical protein [Nanoarchaeota archaeon]
MVNIHKEFDIIKTGKGFTMKGLEINYNFNRRHMSLGKKTPAEIAIPNQS